MELFALAALALVGTIFIGGNCGLISGYPSSIDVLTQFNKLGENHDNSDQVRNERHSDSFRILLMTMNLIPQLRFRPLSEIFATSSNPRTHPTPQ